MDKMGEPIIDWSKKRSNPKQLMSDDGVRLYADKWTQNLFRIPVEDFQTPGKAQDYLLDIWVDFPWNKVDYEAVVELLCRDEEFRHRLRAFDVLYCQERIVEWDREGQRRYSYRYSLENDLLVHQCAQTNRRFDLLAGNHAEEDRRYG